MKSSRQAIASIAFDPGFMPETGLTRTAPKFAQWLIRTPLMKWLFKKLGVTMGSLPFSGSALARITVDEAFTNSSGKYLQSKDGKLTEARSSKVSYDQSRAAKLWNDSENLVHLLPEEHPTKLQ